MSLPIVPLLLALMLAAPVRAQDAQPVPAQADALPSEQADDEPETGIPLSTRRDYSDPAQRELPIACKPGDIELQAGKSLGQVFGTDWPAQSLPSSTTPHSPVRRTAPGRIIWPRGMEGKRGLVVVAVLVSAEGKPLRAEPICATTTGFDMSARRAAMSASYEPATIDGKPVISVRAGVITFAFARKGGRRPRPATDD